MSNMDTKIEAILRRKIEKATESRYAICKTTGVQEGSISNFMNRKRGLNIKTADILLDYFGLEIRPKESRKRGK